MAQHPSFTQSFPKRLAEQFKLFTREWVDHDATTRLFAKDATLWTGHGEEQWLGWIDTIIDNGAFLERLQSWQSFVQASRFKHILLIGMGGSSLAPEVFAQTFDAVEPFPKMHIMDSTDPAQIRATAAALDLTSTLFIVASKSGSTLEPNALRDYFYSLAVDALGSPEKASRHFVAITDPGTSLESYAKEKGFFEIFLGSPSIGGRFSALSPFGLVPLAALGLDVRKILTRARAMLDACHNPVESNPGVWLGLALSAAASLGQDKVILLVAPEIRAIGPWLEQLLAESLGKNGKVILPIVGDPQGDVSVYGDDTMFVYLGVGKGQPSLQQDQARALERGGYPVIRLTINDRYDLGAEMVRWQIATAAAGSLMGLNPFDQPDVEASKIETRKLTDLFEQEGQMPREGAYLTEGSIGFFSDHRNWQTIRAASGVEVLRHHLQRLQPGDYCALLAFVEMNATHQQILGQIRDEILKSKKVATTVQFGPRYLHSTGQAFKGGPNSGVFLQITCDSSEDVTIPGRKASFAIIKEAQARGDFQVLAERGRRLLRVHLSSDVKRDLNTLRNWVVSSLS